MCKSSHGFESKLFGQCTCGTCALVASLEQAGIQGLEGVNLARLACIGNTADSEYCEIVWSIDVYVQGYVGAMDGACILSCSSTCLCGRSVLNVCNQ